MRAGTIAILFSLAAASFLFTTQFSSLFSRGNMVMAATESIATFASNCTTPKTSFFLGDTVCAQASGAPANQRRFQWVAPDGTVAQAAPVNADPATNSFVLPTTGSFAQTGVWTVKTVTRTGVGRVAASFSVLSPTAANADLSIAVQSVATQITAGQNLSFTLTVTNKGPDAALNVLISDDVPVNATFVSETQDSGPIFTCSTGPDVDGINTTSCTISSLAASGTATFTLVYNAPADLPDGTVISNTARISSDTNEADSEDNTSSSTTLVSSTPPPQPCTISCPATINANNDPNAPDPCSTIVTYSTPSTSGSCLDPDTGTTPVVVCSPPSGSAFPVGSTSVVCSAGGTVCSFTVTVNETRPPVLPTITCPGNVSVNETSAGSGSEVVTYNPPATTGNCVTVVCNPPSGSAFITGTTTVNCTGTDSAHNTVSCHFTVTVVSGNCAITCADDVTVNAASGQCSANVTYSAPTVTGACGTVSCTPASGTLFQAGSTIVNCTTGGGPICDFTVTVIASSAPSITTCPANRTISLGSGCETTIPNLVGNGTSNTGEVVATGCSVVVSQSPAAGTIVGPGPHTVTITAENSAGSAVCTTTVTVDTAVEHIPPVITTCASPSSAPANSSCQAAVPNVTGDVFATDNCTNEADLIVTQSPVAGTMVGVGTTTITVTVKDVSNNVATCMTTFTVIDITPPVAVCRNIVVPLDATGNASITATQVDNGSTDNCGTIFRTVSPNTFTCANKGANTVTLTVTDSAGNTATCQPVVTVVDTTPPSITCQPDITVDFNGAGTVVTYTTPVGTDNCPGAITTQIAGLPSGATFPAGITTNTFKVTDAGGLTTQCSFKVIVVLNSILGLDSVSISGAALVDSYNSTGGYPATKGSLADVLSNGIITLANSGKVAGDVRSTRAGVAMSGASLVTGNATAGTTVSRTGSATVNGTITNNQLAPVMTMPPVPACGPPYSSNTGITGTYSYNQTTGDLSLSGVNVATLANGTYCFHNITLTNSAQLKVNGLVVIKLTGTLNAGGATSFTNTTGIPGNLRILSSYTGSNGVVFGNSTSVHLVIYAPNTGVSISGAAPVFGTVVGKSLTISNSGMIHYDTLVKSVWPDIWSLLQ